MRPGDAARSTSREPSGPRLRSIGLAAELPLREAHLLGQGRGDESHAGRDVELLERTLTNEWIDHELMGAENPRRPPA